MYRLLVLALLVVFVSRVHAAEPPAEPTPVAPPPTERFDISQTVLTMKLQKGVSMDDAVDSMKLRANLRNMMFVSHQPLQQQLEAMGVESKRLEIFQFCDPLTARKMVDHNPIFAAYMPCRIAMVEHADGSASLLMFNLEILIDGAELPPELKELAHDVSGKLRDIMAAGATGAL